MQKILCLMGQTATGKTEIAARLSKQFPFKIISVDSSMLYRYMDIGTAKPSKSLLSSVPHKLINILNPESYYSVDDFLRDSYKEISNILESGNIPLLTGGTMMYFHALQHGINFQCFRNNKIFSATRNIFHRGLPYYEKLFLSVLDSRVKKKIQSNTRHVQKSLETYISTSGNLTEACVHSSFFRMHRRYNFINIGIRHSSYDLLRKKIEDRLNLMLRKGLIEEVRLLKFRPGLTRKQPSVAAIAYRQVWDFLEKSSDFDTTKKKIINATVNLAKQQEKWMNRLNNVKYFNGNDVDLYKKVSLEVKKTFST